MTFRLIAQAALIIASFVIFFTFIQPSLAEVKATQDQIFQYKDALDKASQFNARLRELVTIRDSFSPQDLGRLEQFIPDKIDTLSIMKDIETICQLKQAPIISLTAKDIVVPTTDSSFEGHLAASDAVLNLPYQDFDLSFKGDYWQMKDILRMIESHDVLFDVVNVNFTTGETPLVTDDNRVDATTLKGDYTITIRAYGMPQVN
jgi:hypothetical protein